MRELLRCSMNDEGRIEVVVTQFCDDTKAVERLARMVAEMVMRTFGEDVLREFRQQNKPTAH